jgi:hypothetical protein
MASGGRVQAGQKIQQSRLSGAGGADHGEKFSSANREVHSIDRSDLMPGALVVAGELMGSYPGVAAHFLTKQQEHR